MQTRFLQRVLFLALTSLPLGSPLFADVRMPRLFGDHMVLQEGMPIPVWGWAEAGEEVTVTLGGEKAIAKASAEGRWRVKLEALKADGQPLALRVQGTNVIEFKDVLIGDVWLCSGQSNMEFGLERAHNAATEIPQASHPLIRLYTVPRAATIRPLDDVTVAPDGPFSMAVWQPCTPEAVKKNGAWGGFPAVAYFFAKELQKKTGKPIGLINASWGSTAAQMWMSPKALAEDPRLATYLNRYQKIAEAQDSLFPFSASQHTEKMKAWTEAQKTLEAKEIGAAWRKEVEAAKAAGTKPPPPPPGVQKPEYPNLSATAALLFNGMIAPLIPCGIKGVIWYQGEANDGNPVEYAYLFPQLIADWRKHWGQGDFPFVYVQLARFHSPKTGSAPGVEKWAKVREAQRLALSVPNTAMAVALDVGESHEIHPANKEEVGRRLALAAERAAYHQEVVYSGPSYESFKVEGDKVKVSFGNRGGGLVLGSPWFGRPDQFPEAREKLLGFEVAGSDGKWSPAEGRIEGDAVVVWSDAVKQPVSVRYGWANDPICNLFNKEGLPASPFTSAPLK